MEKLTTATAWLNVSEIQLVYKSKVKAAERPQIHQAADAYKVFLYSWDDNRIELQEQFKVMLLNRAHRVLGIYELSTGGTAGTIADIKLIFAAAIKASACNIILSHNHPSQNLHPSDADKKLTTKIANAGLLLDIKLLDHLIIGIEGFYSFANEGLL